MSLGQVLPKSCCFFCSDYFDTKIAEVEEDIRNARDNIQKVVSEGEKAKAAGDEGKQGFWLRTETQLRKELNELLALRKQLWDQKGKESLQLGKGTSLQCCPLPADLSAWRHVNLTSSHQADRVLPCSSNNCRGMTETLVHTQEALLGVIPCGSPEAAIDVRSNGPVWPANEHPARHPGGLCEGHAANCVKCGRCSPCQCMSCLDDTPSQAQALDYPCG